VEEYGGLVSSLKSFNKYLSQDFLGGPRLIKWSTVINIHKGMTIFFVAGLMSWFNTYSPTAWVYLALHGSYGFCWILKHAAFPDKSWDVKITIGGAIITFLILCTYWLAPWLITSGYSSINYNDTSMAYLSFCIILYISGLTLMMAADAQKNFTLKIKSGLITDGMFSKIRFPNYLGEMLLYGAFALLARHWAAWLPLAYIWITIFNTNMQTIEKSLARHPGWKDYKDRTGRLLPKLFTSQKGLT